MVGEAGGGKGRGAFATSSFLLLTSLLCHLAFSPLGFNPSDDGPVLAGAAFGCLASLDRRAGFEPNRRNRSAGHLDRLVRGTLNRLRYACTCIRATRTLSSSPLSGGHSLLEYVKRNFHKLGTTAFFGFYEQWDP